LSLNLPPIVLLAAGASRRLGTPKQLLRLGGEPLVHRAARIALEAGDRVLVVGGHRWPEVARALEDLPVERLYNPQWEEGMASSLRAAVAALGGPGAAVRGALFLVCDQPRLEASLLSSLLEAHRQDPEALVACLYGGTVGIPALVPRRCFGALAALAGDQGARALLRAGPVTGIPFPGGELDLDRPEDLAALPPGLLSP
jgi:molybdenum cofactor cytidylyltransferase